MSGAPRFAVAGAVFLKRSAMADVGPQTFRWTVCGRRMERFGIARLRFGLCTVPAKWAAIRRRQRRRFSPVQMN
jgi:hypothetical protein